MLRSSGVHTSMLGRRLITRIRSEVNGIDRCKGGAFGKGRGRWLVYIRYVFKNSIENSIGVYCMVITEEIVGGSFYVNTKSFNCIEAKALLLDLYYLYNTVDISKGMHVFK